jgi:FAD/FMN-containing dehydrogenase
MGPIVVRVVGLPTEVSSIIESCGAGAWLAHAMNGIVLMAVPDVQTVVRIRERFPAVIESAPPDVRRTAGTFGVRGTAKRLMQDMKQAFDPYGRLNPGRHIDGE